MLRGRQRLELGPGVESSGPWQAGTQRRGRREVCRCGTGSGTREDVGRAGEPYGGDTAGSGSPFPLGASVAVPPPLACRGEAALEGGQGREAQQGGAGGPSSTSQAKRCEKHSEPVRSTSCRARRRSTYLTWLPQPQLHQIIIVIITISEGAGGWSAEPLSDGPWSQLVTQAPGG